MSNILQYSTDILDITIKIDSVHLQDFWDLFVMTVLMMLSGKDKSAKELKMKERVHLLPRGLRAMQRRGRGEPPQTTQTQPFPLQSRRETAVHHHCCVY